MIIYFIYLKGGEAVVSFVGMLHAPNLTAEAITDLLLTYFAENGLDLKKIVAFCSDGASVMTGIHNGVAARLRESTRSFSAFTA